MIRDKLKYFSYLVTKSIYISAGMDQVAINMENTEVALSRSSLKHYFQFKCILFLACTIKQEEGNLLDIFDSWIAAPYGPAESYVKRHLDECPVYQFINNLEGLKIRDFTEFNYDSDDLYYRLIDNALNRLFSINNELFSMTAFDLCELTRACQLYRIVLACSGAHHFSTRIPLDLFRDTVVYYK